MAKTMVAEIIPEAHQPRAMAMLSSTWGLAVPRRGRSSHSDDTLYILYGKPLMKYTGRRQNDCNVQG